MGVLRASFALRLPLTFAPGQVRTPILRKESLRVAACRAVAERRRACRAVAERRRACRAEAERRRNEKPFNVQRFQHATFPIGNREENLAGTVSFAKLALPGFPHLRYLCFLDVQTFLA
jgi:hypothetical protein